MVVTTGDNHNRPARLMLRCASSSKADNIYTCEVTRPLGRVDMPVSFTRSASQNVLPSQKSQEVTNGVDFDVVSGGLEEEESKMWVASEDI